MEKNFNRKASNEPCVVSAGSGVFEACARRLAARLGLPCADARALPESLVLEWTGAGLQLRDNRPGAPGAIRVELASAGVRHRLRRAGGQSELLGRAVGARHGRRPEVVDATAGLGGDAAVLAGMGCRVTMLERSPVLAAMLRDGLERAAEAGLDNNLLSRLRLVETDAVHWLAGLAGDQRPQVVYLDPMYPERRQSAAARKEMQILQRLLGRTGDGGDGLLRAARQAATERVVVKRPRRAPPLDAAVPDHAISGRSTRFDVYIQHDGDT